MIFEGPATTPWHEALFVIFCWVRATQEHVLHTTIHTLRSVERARDECTSMSSLQNKEWGNRVHSSSPHLCHVCVTGKLQDQNAWNQNLRVIWWMILRTVRWARKKSQCQRLKENKRSRTLFTFVLCYVILLHPIYPGMTRVVGTYSVKSFGWANQLRLGRVLYMWWKAPFPFPCTKYIFSWSVLPVSPFTPLHTILFCKLVSRWLGCWDTLFGRLCAG